MSSFLRYFSDIKVISNYNSLIYQPSFAFRGKCLSFPGLDFVHQLFIGNKIAFFNFSITFFQVLIIFLERKIHSIGFSQIYCFQPIVLIDATFETSCMRMQNLSFLKPF